MAGSPESAQRRALSVARRIVVKIGTQVLTGETGGFDRAVFDRLAGELCALVDDQFEVIVVSSGAVGLGVERLGWTERPRDLPGKQAAAAVGQALLMALYESHFQARERHVGQILLSHADLSSRERYLNARHTLGSLLGAGIIPIINENDSVAVEEIMFGDNDALSALVAGLVGADLLVILSDVEGLFDRNPQEDESAQLIPFVEALSETHLAMAEGSSSRFGTGGMQSKLNAVQSASSFGVPVVIAPGRRQGVLRAVLAGEPAGTLFAAPESSLPARKQWIRLVRRVRGRLLLDAGATEALVHGGKSLLPPGVIKVEGEFHAGDLVALVSPDNQEIGQGLVAYDAADLRRIAGAQVREIEARLGYKTTDEVVHRDDLVIDAASRANQPGAAR